MDQFFTIESLKTFAGSVGAVWAITQLLKQVIPASWDVQMTDFLKRSLAVVAAVALQGFLAWNDGASAGGYVMALLNGVGVALAAMKMYEVAPSMTGSSGVKVVAILLLPFVVVACQPGNKTTVNNTTNVTINIDGVDCLTIFIPGVGHVAASDPRLVDNRDGTVTFGDTTYDVNTQCNATAPPAFPPVTG